MDGYFDGSGWKVIRATGRDARVWLGDLLTADIMGLSARRSVTSMLLSPTGRIRAVVAVAALDDGFALVQDAAQPIGIDRLLAPYVLSSDVRLEPTAERVVAVTDPASVASPAWRPSAILGEQGIDLLVAADEVDGITEGLDPIAEAEVARAWAEAGAARFPGDLAGDSLPHEAIYAHAVDDAKGCYLGQEAVAKVRNLGHPQRILLRVLADGPLTPGDEVFADGALAGMVTSAAGELGLARVRWAARKELLQTSAGVRLETLGQAYVRP